MEDSDKNNNKRRKRFQREAGDRKPAIRLQERDREIIKLIYDHRFLTTPMIQQLLPGTHSARGVLLRLQKLYHNHYLDRVRLPDTDNAPIAYALGNRGADIMTLQYGIDRAKVDWTTKNREVTERYIHHALMISRFRAALDLATRPMPEVTMEFWEPEGAVKDEIMYHENGRGLRVPIVPDAFLGVRDGHDLVPFFLEADRSTMSNDRFLTKLRGYYHFWHQKLRRGSERHSADQRSYIMGGHEIRAFRVLVLTLSEQRLENLRHTARNVAPDKGHLALFWFVCEKSYQNDPGRLLAPVWHTPWSTEACVLL